MYEGKALAMGNTSRVSFVPEANKRARLEQIASVFGTNLSAVINEALDQYIDLHEWQLKHIQDGVEEAKQGDFATDEEMHAFFNDYGQPS
jgi:predicted transcriptional regulator